jgi:hypothetical protein
MGKATMAMPRISTTCDRTARPGRRSTMVLPPGKRERRADGRGEGMGGHQYWTFFST